MTNENTVNVKTLERPFNERIDREMSNFVDTVENRIQNAILTAIASIVAPNIELATRSKNASSGRDATGVTANSERREHAGIIAFFGSASGNNIVHTNIRTCQHKYHKTTIYQWLNKPQPMKFQTQTIPLTV